MRLSEFVKFPGFLSREAKLKEGEAHDIYMNTNRTDNMPVSVLEMAAMGLPIVSTRVGGIDDLLDDGETALLVPNEDDRGMADAVVRLLGDEALAARLSSNARHLAHRSDWENIYPAWETLFSELMGMWRDNVRN
jgi:L-malate glycosyltransferase